MPCFQMRHPFFPCLNDQDRDRRIRRLDEPVFRFHISCLSQKRADHGQALTYLLPQPDRILSDATCEDDCIDAPHVDGKLGNTSSDPVGKHLQRPLGLWLALVSSQKYFTKIT